MAKKSRKSSTTNPFAVLAALIITVIAAAFAALSGQLNINFNSPSGIRATASKEPTQPPAAVNPPPSNLEVKWLTVYFTDPEPPDQVNAGIDRYVVPALDDAKRTIDVASFDLNLPSVVDALVRAKKRGLTVRVVADLVEGSTEVKASESANIEPFDALAALRGARIPVVDGGRSNGLMHDKIIIIDSQTLFIGSWNMSYNDTFRNDNNLLRITSQRLIANYQAKFDEMFVDKRFGTKSQLGAQTREMTLDGVPVENYFSPRDEVMQKLVAEIKAAKQSIKFMAFTYTHADLSGAMIERARSGVRVEGVIENRGASQGALVPLFCAGLPVKTDGNKYTMHHKVIIIDDSTVITGSFNFTKSADEINDDNILIIRSTAVAKLYLEEYDRLYSAATTPDNVTC